MKLSLRLQVISLLLFLLPAAAVFAATDANKGSLSIGSAVQVAGKQLAAGEYTVKWDGVGPTAQVNISRDGKVVATVPARVVKLEQKPAHDSVETKTAGNGDRTITSIRFEGKTYALEIGEQSGGADAASSSNLK
jgi:hypothetical protein